jgi:hypothetical protein
MKRWCLPNAQLIISLAMVPQVLLFGLPGVLGSLGMSVTGHFDAHLSGLRDLYFGSLSVKSFTVIFAALLSLTGFALSVIKPSRLSVGFSIVGAVSYWVSIAAHLLMISTLRGGLWVEFTVFDAVAYPIGIVAALMVFVVYSNSDQEPAFFLRLSGLTGRSI